jgi:hypothetical protein
MKKNQFLFFSLAFIVCTVVAHAQKPEAKYFNETFPGTTPVVFAPGKVSQKDQFEFGVVFSKDQREFYYGVFCNGRAETRMVKFENGNWPSLITILAHDVYSYNEARWLRKLTTIKVVFSRE